MVSSNALRRTLGAAIAGVLLALAFPKVGAAWLAPLGAAALFWTWEGASWKRAFALGWFAGWIYCSIAFWWWSNTIVDYVGAFAYAAVMVAAAMEALAFGIAAALAAIVARRTAPALAPLGAALAFTLTEWVRSVGLLGEPFGQLGYTQADTPLRVFAAYIGTSGVTLVLCVLGAYLADALIRKTWRPLAVCVAIIVVAWGGAWAAWPARTLATPTIPVAAVQGNITQTLKWQPGMVEESIRRYTTLTQSLIPQAPRLIVWPETVITVRGLNYSPQLINQFTALAARANATIVVGSVEVRAGQDYNALFIFTPHGLTDTYEKRQLVPFAEFFPGKSFLWWLPYIGELNGGFGEGAVDGVYPTTANLAIAPLICWESAFADLAQAQVRRGAQLLVISTDDAWFGTSSGPYQHAQIAQLRAIEMGMYVVRAAATGISGIIAPDGTWQTQAGLEQLRAVTGRVGMPTGSFFARIGPMPIAAAIAFCYLLLLVIPLRRSNVA